jgi:hypothetical protein
VKIKNSIPFIKKGIGVSQISFSGGRVAASIAGHGGLTHVDYFGRQRLNASTLFRADPISAWAQLFRVCVLVEDGLYDLEFANTSIYPFGFESRCRLGGVDLKHSLTLLNDAMVFQIHVMKNPSRKTLAAKLLLTEAVVRVKEPYRQWGEFSLAGNAATLSITDTYPPASTEAAALTQRDAFGVGDATGAETLVGVTSDAALDLAITPPSFSKIYFSTSRFATEVSLSVAFGHDTAAFKKRLGALRRNASKEAGEVVARFHERQRGRPRMLVGDKVVESLLAMTGPMVDALKVRDLPGAIRAADSGYWVWGWDSMVHSDAAMLYRDAKGVKDMLAFYRDLSHPTLGIPHAITLGGQPLLAMAFPAQGLYGIMLYNAHVFGGDVGVLKEFYPFAKSLTLLAASQEMGTTGMISGVALFPDFPDYLGQDGNDLSVFNNSIFYQALRAMEQIATELQLPEDARDFGRRADRLCKSFRRFFDASKGYFFDSLSTKDLTPRKHYPVYAILWVTPFAADLVRGKEARIARFMRENFPARHGVRMFPTWDDCFMRDGNQFGMYMPVLENFYQQMMLLSKDPEPAAAWRENLAWFWNRLTVPEALACETVNHGATMDNPGRKQAFCAKAWYSMFFHTIAGLDFDLRGIRFSPADAGDMEIKNLTVRGRTIHLQIHGRGWNVGSLKLNGKHLGNRSFLPYSELRKRNVIILKRTIK